MHFYVIENWDGRVAGVAATLAEAHKETRALPGARDDAYRIALWDVPIDRATLVGILLYALAPDGSQPYSLAGTTGAQQLRQWCLTTRGGLREITEDDELAERETALEQSLDARDCCGRG